LHDLLVSEAETGRGAASGARSQPSPPTVPSRGVPTARPGHPKALWGWITHHNFPLLTWTRARLRADACGLAAERWGGNSRLAEGREGGLGRRHGANPTSEIPPGETRSRMVRALQSRWGLPCLPGCALLAVFPAALACVCTLQALIGVAEQNLSAACDAAAISNRRHKLEQINQNQIQFLVRSRRPTRQSAGAIN